MLYIDCQMFAVSKKIEMSFHFYFVGNIICCTFAPAVRVTASLSY